MWGQIWGSMTWGGGSAVPTTGPVGWLVLGMLMGAVVVLYRRPLAKARTTLVMLAVAVVPLVAIGVTLPHTFTNGTVADADEVNANFTALESELNDINATIRDYVNNNCRLYLGWRDSCDGCTAAPAKWGYVNDQSCSNGSGADNTCTTPNLGGDVIRTFGLNTDGDVDGSDKLYIGLRCF